ncbi:hypothetical protein BdWA1_002873 [Babesia duncani]|uniref:Uncharacterized protein n=1 Tax=Babesia duncani TaxID=323732 RepID=A0AAD9PI00_9APIC|nr:hypothetical protein BdWA1_002873 [Babesia duncani]
MGYANVISADIKKFKETLANEITTREEYEKLKADIASTRAIMGDLKSNVRVLTRLLNEVYILKTLMREEDVRALGDLSMEAKTLVAGKKELQIKLENEIREIKKKVDGLPLTKKILEENTEQLLEEISKIEMHVKKSAEAIEKNIDECNDKITQTNVMAEEEHEALTNKLGITKIVLNGIKTGLLKLISISNRLKAATSGATREENKILKETILNRIKFILAEGDVVFKRLEKDMTDIEKRIKRIPIEGTLPDLNTHGGYGTIETH